MKSISFFKTDDVLLETSLESLHAESVSWLHELEFWNEELAFFARLLAHAEFSKPFPKQEVAEMEKAIITLRADRIEKLKDRVSGHEGSLPALFKRESLTSELTYRELHRELLRDVGNLFGEIRNFKKTLFSFVERS